MIDKEGFFDVLDSFIDDRVVIPSISRVADAASEWATASSACFRRPTQHCHETRLINRQG